VCAIALEHTSAYVSIRQHTSAHVLREAGRRRDEEDLRAIALEVDERWSELFSCQYLLVQKYLLTSTTVLAYLLTSAGASSSAVSIY